MSGFTLVTERTEISPARGDELATLRSIATAPDVARMLFIFSPAMSEAEFAATHPPVAEAPPFRLAIRAEGRVIGSIGVGAGPVAPVFYFFSREAAGRGFASEVVPAFCEAVLTAFPLEALTAEVFDDNPASARVLEKAGFLRVGAVTCVSAGRDAPAPGSAWCRARPAVTFRMPPDPLPCCGRRS